MKDLIFYLHQDGGHAWLKVSKDTFNRTNLSMRHISSYSYHDNENYYLEEDVDATQYLNNLKDQNIKFSFIFVDDGDYSPIRHLPHVEMVGGLLKEPKQLVLRGF
tara:strand:+ start:383 stop:697 length:315 start_codon:yes stop_codon:yes gene_type:complete